MTITIAMSRKIDLNAIAVAAEAGERPRHATGQLAEAIGAEVVTPEGLPIRTIDRVRARVWGLPDTWALARDLRRRLRPGDVIFCPDESIGVPVAALCGGRNGVQVAMLVHNIIRPRARLAMRLLRISRKTALFMAVSRLQTRFLASAFHVPQDRLSAIYDQTDLRFFSAVPPEHKSRPVIMSIGLEKRDYRTLAEATGDLDVDVRISGYSADATVVAKAFPPVLPSNMSRSFYAWKDLRALYATADLVVVSLVPNRYAAGVSALLEAIATETPVVVTATEGLAEYLQEPELISQVPLQDAAAMRDAIQRKLRDPVAAKATARLARQHFAEHIDSERYVRDIAEKLEELTLAGTRRIEGRDGHRHQRRHDRRELPHAGPDDRLH